MLRYANVLDKLNMEPRRDQDEGYTVSLYVNMCNESGKLIATL
jgi:hypothetical protein